MLTMTLWSYGTEEEEEEEFKTLKQLGWNEP